MAGPLHVAADAAIDNEQSDDTVQVGLTLLVPCAIQDPLVLILKACCKSRYGSGPI